MISYDPNYRSLLWKIRKDDMGRMREPLPEVDFLKVSDGEIELLTDCTDLRTGAAGLLG